MPLNTQQFAEVVAGLRSYSTVDRGHELRSASRIEVNCKVVIWPIGDAGKPGEARTVMARDASFSGVGLLSSVPLTGGQQFIAGLARAKHQPLLVRCTTRHCRELADGIFAIGAAYEQVVERTTAARAA